MRRDQPATGEESVGDATTSAKPPEIDDISNVFTSISNDTEAPHYTDSKWDVTTITVDKLRGSITPDRADDDADIYMDDGATFNASFAEQLTSTQATSSADTAGPWRKCSG